MAGTVLLTGANGSLALGFVEAFLQSYPQHTLVATVRDPSPVTDANTARLEQLVSRYPGAQVYIQALDLGKLSSVRSFAEKLSRDVLSKKLPRISAIVCNAATLSLEAGQKFTVDNYEATFQVCHLSHYLLVLKLLQRMDTSGRIVMLGSVTHDSNNANPLSSLVAQFPDDIEELVKPRPDPPGLVHDRGFQRYATAKLANVTFMDHLNRLLLESPSLSHITATAMDPGGLPSSRAQTEQKKSTQRLFATINFLMPVLKHLTKAFRTTEDAGRDLVALSVGPSFQGKRGYFVGQKQTDAAAASKDEGAQNKLWEACWRWAGLVPGETVLQM
ncbi:short-chain dehydrogenase/reductase SDR [Aspergillus terreus]|uniref:3beta-hydroxysteroid 3-dehydrogenase n=1 Tax=Aspergillus terreus TaxID=33178 RepID=A0A5M3ZD56_ASPTE|nr:hypothetical protein ATETN484_0012028900 [Aspergillus terreus]GFF19537.1 short-chain dehydrogenase/reductase SDR [Aspergillus terreus]